MKLYRIKENDEYHGWDFDYATKVGVLEPAEPAGQITITNGKTPASWDSTYNDDESIKKEASIVYSCDGCPAEWDIPDGTYTLIKTENDT